ncbi:MAG: exodeoxyribonuclease VII small subunit [Thermoplasmata archaeon]|nr:exodeoxyribonuclease VII small subunit [Thermoplasmata archaeon]
MVEDPETAPELSFEEALGKLENNVRTLEVGELSLEESLKIFEEGMKLSKLCSSKLEEAEQKIEILLEQEGKLVTEEFEVEEPEGQ